MIDFKTNYKSNVLSFSLKKKIIKTINLNKLVLIHECEDLNNNKGRDIDALFFNKVFNPRINDKDIFLHSRSKYSCRLHINDKDKLFFATIDLESIYSFENKNFLILNYTNAKICSKTKCKHLDLFAIVYIKTLKYFVFPGIHSYRQLLFLKKNFNKLNKKQKIALMNQVNKISPLIFDHIKKLFFKKFKDYINNLNIKKFWKKKNSQRNKKRLVYNGKINFWNAIRSIRFIYAFIFGSLAIWPKSHSPMPALAIVGNDGSGKTTLCKYLVNNFVKLDPVIFSMRSSDSIMNFVKKIILKIYKLKKIKKNFFLNFICYLIYFFGYIIDLIDKYLRYKIGIAWADSGHGITIFERYPTDRIRGEYPNQKLFFFPFEQYFPMPDAFVYLDISPKLSVLRKPNDSHTIHEMRCKRLNYLSLLKEFDEVKKISLHKNFNKKIQIVKNYIFEICLIKKNLIKKNFMINKRVVWKKNKNRHLIGKNNERIQKNSIF